MHRTQSEVLRRNKCSRRLGLSVCILYQRFVSKNSRSWSSLKLICGTCETRLRQREGTDISSCDNDGWRWWHWHRFPADKNMLLLLKFFMELQKDQLSPGTSRRTSNSWTPSSGSSTSLFSLLLSTTKTHAGPLKMHSEGMSIETENSEERHQQ